VADEEAEQVGDDGSEADPNLPASARIHWKQLTLYFADGSGLRSSWNAEQDRAEQTGGQRHMDTQAATAEHLRALEELRDCGGATNWYTNPELDAEAAPHPDEVDWTGFEGVVS
jgi:hypothetical protein